MSRLGRTFKAGRPNVPPFLSPTSFFNRPLGITDEVATDQSPAQHLANQCYYAYQGGAYTWQGYSGPGYGGANWPDSIGFNGPSKYSVPIYCVRPSVASQNITHQTVSFYWGSGPYNHYANLSGLETFLASVPLPDKTQCPNITGTGDYVDIWSGGTDQYCAIWNLDSDEWWEFWLLSNNKSDVQAFTGTTWNAGYGGYIPNVSTCNGTIPHIWGARACSVHLAGGIITMQDLRDVANGGTINHALCVASGCTGGGSGIAPATRADGEGALGNYFPATIPSGYPNAGATNPAYHQDVVYEAQRFRFPANIDLSSSNLTSYPLALAISRAIRDYGLYVVDTTAGVGMFMEDYRTIGSPYHLQGPSAVDPWTLTWPGGDPRYGGSALGTGWTVLNNVPWAQLQALNPISS